MVIQLRRQDFYCRGSNWHNVINKKRAATSKPFIRELEQSFTQLGDTATEGGGRLKFRTKKAEELYYICTVNKGADQIHR